MKYKEIVFDIDGTLLDTEYGILHSLQDTVRHFTGRIPELRDLTFALGIPGKDALIRLGIENVDDALAYWEQLLKTYHETVRIFDGIEVLLHNLTVDGFRLGIVTSKTREEYKADLARFGLDRYFTTIVCADDTENHKPNPDPLLKYMEKANCSETDILYIGDSIYDRQCAQAANCAFALALWGAKKRMAGVRAYGMPDEILRSLT